MDTIGDPSSADDSFMEPVYEIDTDIVLPQFVLQGQMLSVHIQGNPTSYIDSKVY